MKKISKIGVGQIALFVLMTAVIVDPTNTLFKMKEVAFAFVLFSLFFHKLKVYKDALIILLISFSILIISSINGHFCGYEFDKQLELSYYKSFLFLFVLLLAKNKHYNFLTAIIPAGIIISIITIYVYLQYDSKGMINEKLYNFLESNDFFVMVGSRKHFNHIIYTAFYKTSPVLVIIMAYIFAIFLDTKEKRYLVCSILFFVVLLLSGTRANILSAILLPVFITLWTKIKNKYLIVIAIIFCIIVAGAYLLSDKNESSIRIKSNTLHNTIELVKNDHHILLLGQGCGSLFFGDSERGITGRTELSYLELLRMFGILGALVIIFFLIYPLILMFRLKPDYYISFAAGYAAYLFIGGTNPLLIGSTGFTVLAIAYSFAFGNSKLILKR